MPKPVKKKPVPKKKSPTRKRRPSSDPNLRAHQLMQEHMAKAGGGLEPPIVIQGLDDALRAYMAKLGTKGGTISGAKRMEMPAKQRREIAMKAARARWKNRPGQS